MGVKKIEKNYTHNEVLVIMIPLELINIVFNYLTNDELMMCGSIAKHKYQLRINKLLSQHTYRKLRFDFLQSMYNDFLDNIPERVYQFTKPTWYFGRLYQVAETNTLFFEKYTKYTGMNEKTELLRAIEDAMFMSANKLLCVR